jgi:hypothetical protein
MAKALLIGKTIAWTLVTLAIGLVVLGLWGSSRLPRSDLKIAESRGFEALAKTGRLHCLAPQHYSLAEIKRINPEAETALRTLVPEDIVEKRNVDDINSMVSVVDGKGVYTRYFGSHTLAEVPICW